MENKENKNSIAIGSDHAGYQLKMELIGFLEPLGYLLEDAGCDSEDSCDYPDYAGIVASKVSRGENTLGILVCGTGAGMSIVANKFSGVRAALCNDLYTAEYCRKHNDANILTIGSRINGPSEAREIVIKFLETGFEGDGESGERHKRRLLKIKDIEKDNFK